MHIHRVQRAFAALCLAGVVAGCRNPVGADKIPAPDPTQVTYAASLGIDLTTFQKTAAGVYYKDVTPGTGAVVGASDSVSVGYTGWLTDGTQFDSNTGAGGTPFNFRLGKGTVIKGWDDAVPGIRVGGTRKLVIPSQLAYGTTGNSRIPGNAILVFSVTALKIF